MAIRFDELPNYLSPWYDHLPNGWPDVAGPIPTEQEISEAISLGVRPGTKLSLAWAMYRRHEGGTNSEVETLLHDTITAQAGQKARNGLLEFNKKRRPDDEYAYYIGEIGSRPGGEGAEQAHRGDPEGAF